MPNKKVQSKLVSKNKVTNDLIKNRFLFLLATAKLKVRVIKRKMKWS